MTYIRSTVTAVDLLVDFILYLQKIIIATVSTPDTIIVPFLGGATKEEDTGREPPRELVTR